MVKARAASAPAHKAHAQLKNMQRETEREIPADNWEAALAAGRGWEAPLGMCSSRPCNQQNENHVSRRSVRQRARDIHIPPPKGKIGPSFRVLMEPPQTVEPKA